MTRELVLLSSRIKLRPIRMRDAEKIVECVNEPGVLEKLKYFSFFQESLTLKKERRYIGRMKDLANNQIYVIETSCGELVGTIGLHEIDRFNNNLRLGIIIFNSRFVRQGYAKEAIGAILPFVFDRLRMNKIYLTARVDNDLAIRIYTKLGFQKEGVLREEYCVGEGQYLDLQRMSILKSEWEERLSE
ncbi:GNAT family N-acetyltransferase [Patescibacteria group bacterium]